MKATILGLGYYLPDKVLTNQDLEKMVDTSDTWIVERSGIRERHILAPDEPCSLMAVEAARRALQDANLDAAELDMIIVGTVSGDMLFPATACLLQAELGAVNAAAFDLGAGCTGFIYALAVAEKFLLASAMSHILVVGAEAVSKVLDYTDRSTCVLFGDGAGAVVMGKADGDYGIITSYLGADGRGAKDLYMPAGGSAIPATAESVAQRLHYLRMNGTEIFKFATKAMPEISDKLVNQAGLSYRDIDLFIPHQANLRIIQLAAKRMQIPMEKVLINLDRCGNTSAGSIPVALAEAYEQGRLKKGDIILMVAFGAGLTFGGAILRWGRD
ncbi:MAG: beta-ketoacyl-ACP synthase III [Syntrophomonadaceae bacterium]